MFIYYYTIPKCIFEFHETQSVILPPKGTAEGLLHQYGFQQNENGNWYKIPNPQEYEAIMKGYPNYHVIFSFDAPPAYEQDFQNPAPPPPVQSYPPPSYPEFQEKPETSGRTANILCCIALALLALAFIIICISTEGPALMLSFGSVILSCILTIIVRLRYPDSVFGKIMLGILILLFILFIIAVVEVIIECINCLDSCWSCSW